MIKNIAKMICDLQGAELHCYAEVICPTCDRKTMMINLDTGKCFCTNCKKKYKSSMELWEIIQEDFRKNNEFCYDMEHNKGVCD